MEPIIGITAVTIAAIHIFNKPYTVSMASGIFNSNERKKSFRTYDDALKYAKEMSTSFTYVWVKHRSTIDRVKPTSVTRLKGSV